LSVEKECELTTVGTCPEPLDDFLRQPIEERARNFELTCGRAARGWRRPFAERRGFGYWPVAVAEHESLTRTQIRQEL
jgi:hypothetical protein